MCCCAPWVCRFPESEFAATFQRFFGPTRANREVCSIGFEPNPLHYEHHHRLRDVYKAKGWHYELVAAAAGARPANLTFYHNKNYNSRGNKKYQAPELGFGVKPRGTGGSVTVPVIDFADFLIKHVHGRRLPEAATPRSLPPRVVVKMDIEGAEYAVVPHLIDTGALCQAVSFITFEWHIRQKFLPMNVTDMSAQSPSWDAAVLQRPSLRGPRVVKSTKEAEWLSRFLKQRMAHQSKNLECTSHYQTLDLDDESYALGVPL